MFPFLCILRFPGLVRFLPRACFIVCLSFLPSLSGEVPKEPVSLSFVQLSDFEYPEDMPPGDPMAAIPSTLQALHGKRVSIEGFMLPVRVDKGRARELLILKDQNACCFGRMPRINEWILVQAAEKGLPIAMDVPLRFEGRLVVGARREGDFVVGIYALEDASLTRLN